MPFLCPTCDQKFDTDLGRCPSDGDQLVPFKDPDGLVGKVIDGRFEVKRLLGRGGMGSVYLAHQRSVDRLVALKVMKRELLEDQAQVKRFILEARAASRLTNNHTITIFDFGKSDEGVLYIAMEYLRGEALREHLNHHGPMPVDEVVRVASEIAESLAEAHEHGIVHRDLKPENVFFATTGGKEGVVKVLDFGIARARSLQAGTAVTGTGVIMGTPAYMSPEMIMGEPVDARADLYALGIMMYEMVTGLLPFQAETPMQVLLKHLHSEPEAIEQVLPDVRVPVALQRFVWKCLSKNRNQRPTDARAFLSELQAAQADTGADDQMFPVYSTSAGFRVDADSLDLLTTKKRLMVPPSTPASTGGGTAEPARYVSDIVVEHRSGSLPWVVLAAVAVLGLAVAMLFLVRASGLPAATPSTLAAVSATDPAEPSASPAPPIVVAPRPETVSLSLTSTPNGASIRLNGDEAGITPKVVRVPKGTDGVQVELSLAGHEPLAFTVVPDQDRIEQKTLAPTPLPVATPSAEPGADEGVVPSAPEAAEPARKAPPTRKSESIRTVPQPRAPSNTKPADSAPHKTVDERAGEWM